MTREDRFSHLVENMYKAALAEGRWVSVAGLIDDAISTIGHSLTYVEVGPEGQSDIWLSQFFVDSERREDLRQLYFGDYFKRDEAIPRLAGLRDGELVHKADLYTDLEKKRSPVYAFRTQQYTEDGLFMAIDGLDGTAIVWSCGNTTERCGWGHDQIRTIQRLAPHIRQFSRVRRALAKADALGASFAGLLENKGLGLIQLDGRGRIVEANDRARDVLLKRDGLRDDRGVLVAVHKGENDQLQRLLAQVSPPFGDQGTGGSMKVTRTETRDAAGPRNPPCAGNEDESLHAPGQGTGAGCRPGAPTPCRSGPGGRGVRPDARGEPSGRGHRVGGHGCPHRTHAELRRKHREDSRQASLPQAGDPQADGTRAEGAVTGGLSNVGPLDVVLVR